MGLVGGMCSSSVLILLLLVQQSNFWCFDGPYTYICLSSFQEISQTKEIIPTFRFCLLAYHSQMAIYFSENHTSQKIKGILGIHQACVSQYLY